MRLVNKCLMLIGVLAFSLAAFAQNDSLPTCSACLCAEDQTPAGVMISHIHEKNQWMISYRFMTMQMGNMLVGKNRLSDNEIYKNYLMSSDQMRMDMHMLMVMYGVSNRLTLMGMLNYNFNKMNMLMLSGSHHHMGTGNDTEDDPFMKSSGIADAKIHALYGIINSPRHHLLISAGVNIPTGTIKLNGERNSMYTGSRLPYAMQLGSGTWDIYNTLSYLHQNGDISWSSQVTSVIRPGINSLGYRLGNEFVFNNWLAWQWSGSFSSSVRVEAQTIGKINGRDKSLYPSYEPAANSANYGGQKAFAYLGTVMFLHGDILNGQRLAVEAGLPLFQYLNGPQMKSNYTIIASWNLVF